MNREGQSEIAPPPAHILIAEDSPTQAERLRYILEQNGYRVTTAVNGRQALEVIQSQKPTLILTDILMPEMDGYQLCWQIKSSPELKDIPVILVTTLADPQDVIRGLECHADNFVIKPYNEHYLLSRIQFVLLNNEIQERDRSGMGIEIYFNGQRHFITADRLQILNLLLSTYEVAIQRNQELTHTKDELRNLNTSLEAANKELETFSYSVSHDLRAPLRSIDGNSQVLLEDHAHQLDEQGKVLIGRIQEGCERMAQLIEDLLNLSRLSRTEMYREEVNLSELVSSILSELQRSQPEREASFKIIEGLTADADAQLLRIALENLLGNAWKFTSKQPCTVIEFGVKQQENHQVFFIRDNGAGFNMAYANKLFGAFQRLHANTEFEGTGIGLATVQRVIARHGGRIWAESELEKGATFFFIL